MLMVTGAEIADPTVTCAVAVMVSLALAGIRESRQVTAMTAMNLVRERLSQGGIDMLGIQHRACHSISRQTGDERRLRTLPRRSWPLVLRRIGVSPRGHSGSTEICPAARRITSCVFVRL